MRLYLLIVLVFSLAACEENAPDIPPLGPQEVGERRILIEEFTGVRCPNCPDGSAEIENLVALYGDALVPISIHSSGNFAIPLPDSKYDFRTETGDQLLDFLGQPRGYPAAVVNRTLPEGEPSLQQGQAAWAGLIERAVAEEPIVAINLSIDFDEAVRELSVTARVVPSQTIDESLRLSVMLVEDHVVDPQITQDGIIDEYDHRHVFRAMLTNTEGNPLGDSFSAGKTVPFDESFSLPDAWVAANCEVVAFVHKVGENKDILQVTTAHL